MFQKFSKMTFALGLALLACSGEQAQISSNRVEAQISGKQISLYAPTGFCFDAATFTKTRGQMTAQEQVDIVASPCEIQDGKIVVKPLTHSIFYGAKLAEQINLKVFEQLFLENDHPKPKTWIVDDVLWIQNSATSKKSWQVRTLFSNNGINYLIMVKEHQQTRSHTHSLEIMNQIVKRVKEN